MKTKHTKATVAEPPKRQLKNTPINRAFLFLYRGVMQGSIKVPTITDMSDDNAENYPMISGEEYMRKAMDAQIEHEAKPSNAELVAALEGLEKQQEAAVAALGWRLSPTAGWGFPPGQSEAVQIPPLAEIIACQKSELLDALSDANAEIRQFRKEANDEASRHGTLNVPYESLDNPAARAALAKAGRGVEGGGE